MIISRSSERKLKIVFSNGRNEGIADAIEEHGGKGEGFRPHDLLEAALATCLNMAIQMNAENLNIPLSQVTTTVNLDRSSPMDTVFKYSIDLGDGLTSEQREQLLGQGKTCAVRQTLMRDISFVQVDK